MTEPLPKQIVMMVDDAPANLRLLSEILESAGFEVLAFLRGAQALEAVESNLPDLILLDIAMPEMDGFELCKRLKERKELRDVPVIFISASTEMDDKIRAFQAGGVDYVTKPFRQEEVLARVGVQLELLRARKVLEAQNKDLQDAVERLTLTQSKLTQAEKMAAVGVLAAGVAHEINNPLNYLNSSAVTVKRKVDEMAALLDQEGRATSGGPERSGVTAVDTAPWEDCARLYRVLSELSENILDGASRASEIVRGLRLFARVDRSDPEMFDLHQGLEATLSLLSHRMKDRIQLERDYGELPRVEGYPGKLNQVFMNILVNAVDVLETQGGEDDRIVVRTCLEERSQAPWVSISVIDNGPGMAVDSLSRVFEPFYTTKGVGEGTGLGLSISHGIVQEHGGTIEAANETGGGARFTIALPVSASTTGENEGA